MNYNILGEELLKRLTEDGTKPIDKEVIATLSTDEIEALIIAIRAIENERTYQTLSNLLDEHLRREPASEGGFIVPPCVHHWEVPGIELCDNGGGYAVIEAGQCENCPNYRVFNLDWERYQKPMPEDY